MDQILLGLGIWSLIFLVATAALGFGVMPSAGAGTHPAAGIFSALLAVLSQSLVFIHFLGSGRVVKESVRMHGLDRSFEARARKFKARAFPPATLAIVLLAAAAIAGGWTRGGVLPMGIHRTIALLAIIAQAVSLSIEVRVAGENARLLEELEEACRARVEGPREGAAPGPGSGATGGGAEPGAKEAGAPGAAATPS